MSALSSWAASLALSQTRIERDDHQLGKAHAPKRLRGGLVLVLDLVLVLVAECMWHAGVPHRTEVIPRVINA